MGRRDRRQFLANRERREFLAILELERHVRLNDERLRPGAQAAKRRFDFTFIARKYKFCLQTHRERRFLRVRDHHPRNICVFDIDENSDTLCCWQQFVQQPDPFRRNLEIHRADAGDVAAGMIKAFDKPASHRIGARRKDNRDRCRHRFGCARGRQRVERHDDRRPVLHQFSRQSGQEVGVTACRSKFADVVLAFDEADFANAVAHGSDKHSGNLWLTLCQIANHWRNGLRACRERPSDG